MKKIIIAVGVIVTIIVVSLIIKTISNTMSLSEMKTKSAIGSLQISKYSKENLQIFKTINISAKPEVIWKTVGNVGAVSEWIPGVEHVEVTPNSIGNKNDVGCKRACKIGNISLEETVVHYEPNKLFAYMAADTEMAESNLGVIELIDNGTYTTVNWYQYFKPKGLKGFVMRNFLLPKALKQALINLEKRSV